MPTTLVCATQIHSGDTRTYVSVGELATPTVPTGKIGIIRELSDILRQRQRQRERQICIIFLT